MRAKVISIFTQKGGVSKTTSTINIAGVLSEMGYKTLVIDFDTQCHTSLGYGVDDEIEFDVSNFLHSKETPIYTQRGFDENISIIAGNLKLTTGNLKRDSLKKAIARVENDFHFILIDCPPKPISEDLSFGEIAVFASDFIISPIDYDIFTIDGVTKLIVAINELKAEKGLKAEYLGFFFAKVEENTRDFKETYKELLESQISNLLFKSYVRKDALIRKAISEGESAVFLKPYSRVSMDYRKLSDEIISKIKDNG